MENMRARCGRPSQIHAKTERLTVNLTSEQADFMRKRAAAERMSLSAAFRSLVEREIAERGVEREEGADE